VVVFNRLVNSLRTVLYLSSFRSSPFLVYAYARWNYFGGKSSFDTQNMSRHEDIMGKIRSTGLYTY
jgi:hypothetical protein